MFSRSARQARKARRGAAARVSGAGRTTSSRADLPTWMRAAAGIAAGSAVAVGVALADDAMHPPHYDWSHKGYFSAFDTNALRRGYEVYRQVCSTCHSADTLAYRNLVGVTHTEEQAKMIAASVEVRDGPNDEGAMFSRPGTLSDRFKRPYANDEEARYSNGGALPPDFSQLAKARHGGEDYIMALLTGYRDPPAGVSVRDGLHYNPYFPGGAIAMAAPLADGQIDYEDGTPATVSQMSRDVATFMAWASEPESDARKKAGVKWIAFLMIAAGITGWYKRYRWSILKTRKIQFKV